LLALRTIVADFARVAVAVIGGCWLLASAAAAQGNSAPPGDAQRRDPRIAERLSSGPPRQKETPVVAVQRAAGVIDEPVAATLDGHDGRELLLRNFRPNSQLRVAQNPKMQAKFPVVDVHTHFRYKLRANQQSLDDFVETMDRNQIAVCVSLDGRLGDQLDGHIDFLWSQYKDRFAIFANVDWCGDGKTDDPATWACHRDGFAERTAQQLAAAVDRGVCGLKVFKRFGLGYRNPDGSLIKIDDRRFFPIWQACGELGIPVIIHAADPAAFFEPIDAANERWEELSRHPDWSFHGGDFPSRDELLAARNRIIAHHPKTQFIGAHVANNAEDLQTVGKWLDRYPNLWIEPASRISEMGRQPFTARDFLMRYRDRLLFGTDGPWPEKRLQLYWRFFETRDESFPYSEKIPPPQGMWQIYGVDLPDEVLRKLYYENSAKLIPGIAWRLDAFRNRSTVGDSPEGGEK
jgi:predicted TIM-barrel fold metal-dependent hydrolase